MNIKALNIKIQRNRTHSLHKTKLLYINEKKRLYTLVMNKIESHQNDLF